MRLRPELMNLLRDVVREQAPDLSGAVDRLERGALPSRQEAGRLIRLLCMEVARTGFFETDESVRRGLMLEELADFFGDIDYDGERHPPKS